MSFFICLFTLLSLLLFFFKSIAWNLLSQIPYSVSVAVIPFPFPDYGLRVLVLPRFERILVICIYLWKKRIFHQKTHTVILVIHYVTLKYERNRIFYPCRENSNLSDFCSQALLSLIGVLSIVQLSTTCLWSFPCQPSRRQSWEKNRNAKQNITSN